MTVSTLNLFIGTHFIQTCKRAYEQGLVLSEAYLNCPTLNTMQFKFDNACSNEQ